MDISDILPLYNTGKYKDVIAACEKIEKKVGDEGAQIFQLHALSEYNLKNYERAITLYESAVNLSPEDLSLLSNYGEVLRATGNVRRSLSILSKANRTSPDNANILANLIIAMLDGLSVGLENITPSDVLENISTLTRQKPGNEKALRALYRLANEHALYTEALEIFYSNLKNTALTKELLFLLADIHISSGSLQNSISILAKLIEKSPDDAKYYYKLGQALFKSGQEEEAKRALLRAISLDRSLSEQKNGSLKAVNHVNIGEWILRNSSQVITVSGAESYSYKNPCVISIDGTQTEWTIHEANLPPRHILGPIDVEVYPQEFVVLTSENELLTERLVTSPITYARKETLVKYTNQKRYLIEKPTTPKFFNSPCAIIGRDINHYHFTYESLTRICQLTEARLEHLPIVVPDGLHLNQIKLLKHLGYTTDKIITLSSDEYLKCKQAYIPLLANNGYNLPQKETRWLRTKFKTYPAKGRYSERLYLSRNKIPKRNIRNELDLEEILHSHGFQKIYMEELSLEEQISAFRNATAILSTDGSALANLIHCEKRTQIALAGVINTAGVSKPHYYYIAKHLDLDLTYIEATPIPTPNIPIGDQDLILPPESLEKWIDLISKDIR